MVFVKRPICKASELSKLIVLYSFIVVCAQICFIQINNVLHLFSKSNFEWHICTIHIYRDDSCFLKTNRERVFHYRRVSRARRFSVILHKENGPSLLIYETLHNILYSNSLKIEKTWPDHIRKLLLYLIKKQKKILEVE